MKEKIMILFLMISVLVSFLHSENNDRIKLEINDKSETETYKIEFPIENKDEKFMILTSKSEVALAPNGKYVAVREIIRKKNIQKIRIYDNNKEIFLEKETEIIGGFLVNNTGKIILYGQKSNFYSDGTIVWASSFYETDKFIVYDEKGNLLIKLDYNAYEQKFTKIINNEELSKNLENELNFPFWHYYLRYSEFGKYLIMYSYVSDDPKSGICEFDNQSIYIYIFNENFEVVGKNKLDEKIIGYPLMYLNFKDTNEQENYFSLYYQGLLDDNSNVLKETLYFDFTGKFIKKSKGWDTEE